MSGTRRLPGSGRPRSGFTPSLTGLSSRWCTGGKFDEKLLKAAWIAVWEVLKIKRGERVLIVTNPGPDVWRISAAIYDVSEQVGAEAALIGQPEKTQLDFASDAVIHALRSEPDVIISISSRKLGKDRFGLQQPYSFGGKTADHIFSALIQGGRSRGFWSPGVTLETFARAVPIDYALLRKQAKRLKAVLDQADSVHISSPSGTDLTIGLRGRAAHTDDGDLSKPGRGGNLPAGEVFISPALGQAEGRVVFDGSIALAEGEAVLPDEPVVAEVSEGRAVRIYGGETAAMLEYSLASAEKQAHRMVHESGWPTAKAVSYAHCARHLGELGIGLNPEARLVGRMLEDEKAAGTCHIALGSNYDRDAQALVHLDCLIKKPTIVATYPSGRRRVIMEDGEIV